MKSKIKTIIIIGIVATALILIYIFLIKKSGDDVPGLTSSSETQPFTNPDTTVPMETVQTTSALSRDFLTMLLSVKGIKLNDSIFSDPAFSTLHDSTILLIPDGTEGRPNPFAPIGSDLMASPINLNADQFLNNTGGIPSTETNN